MERRRMRVCGCGSEGLLKTGPNAGSKIGLVGSSNVPKDQTSCEGSQRHQYSSQFRASKAVLPVFGLHGEEGGRRQYLRRSRTRAGRVKEASSLSFRLGQECGLSCPRVKETAKRQRTALAPKPRGRSSSGLSRSSGLVLARCSAALGSGHPVAWRWDDGQLASKVLVFTAAVQCSILTLGQWQ